MAPKTLSLTLVPDPATPRATAATPVTLESFGEVLTDGDLERLLQLPPRWAIQRRWEAKRRGEPPNLPEAIPGTGRARYTKDAVAVWLYGRRGRRR